MKQIYQRALKAANDFGYQKESPEYVIPFLVLFGGILIMFTLICRRPKLNNTYLIYLSGNSLQTFCILFGGPNPRDRWSVSFGSWIFIFPEFISLAHELLMIGLYFTR